MKQRFEAYRREPEAGFSLAESELGMLIEDPEAPALYLALHDEGVHGSIAWPARFGRCWPVTFAGRLRVDDARAYFSPDHITIGALDLGWYYRGRTLALGPDDMPSSRMSLFLEQTRHADVRGGRFEVDLLAPETFRFR